MNIKEMVKRKLQEDGYDGLFDSESECSCEIRDLMPCSGVSEDCQAGYKTACDCEGTPCTFHMVAEKPKTT